MKKAAPHIRIYSRRARFSRARQCDRRRRVAHLEGPPFPEPRNGIHRRPFRGEHGALDAVAAHGHRRARGWLPLRPSPPLRTADVPRTVHVSLAGMRAAGPALGAPMSSIGFFRRNATRHFFNGGPSGLEWGCALGRCRFGDRRSPLFRCVSPERASHRFGAIFLPC